MSTFKEIALNEAAMKKKELDALEKLGKETIKELGSKFTYKVDKFLGLKIFNNKNMLIYKALAFEKPKEIAKKVVKADKAESKKGVADMPKDLDWKKQKSKDGYWTGD